MLFQVWNKYVPHDDWSRRRNNAMKNYTSKYTYEPSAPPSNKSRGKKSKQKRNTPKKMYETSLPLDNWMIANPGTPGYVSAPPMFGLVYLPYERIVEYLSRPLTDRDINKPRPPNTYTLEFMKQLTEEMLNDPLLGCRGRVTSIINSDGTVNISPTYYDPPDPRFWEFKDFYVYRPPRF